MALLDDEPHITTVTAETPVFAESSVAARDGERAQREPERSRGISR